MAVEAASLRYDSAPARRERIVELVREVGFCSAGELSRALGVSEMTIRRDVHRLDEVGLVRAVHGGVSAVTTLLGPVDFRLRSTQQLGAKRAIAQKAIELVADGSVVALDAGTTTLEVARGLPGDRRLKVVTHSLPAMAALSGRPGIEVVGLGGALHPETQAFAGPLTLSALGEMRMNLVFLAATAVRDTATWCTNTFDAETKRALVAAADRVALLVDSSKFTLTALMKAVPLEDVDTVITDDGIETEARRMLDASGVELVVVPSRTTGVTG